MAKKIRILCVFVLLITVFTLTGCGSDGSNTTSPTSPFTIEVGTYGLDNAVLTNISTKEVTEKVFDDILGDKEWRWLLSFGVQVKQDSTWARNADNNWVMIHGGHAYELVENNTFELHFPRYQAYDYKTYDVVITLGKHKVYG